MNDDHDEYASPEPGSPAVALLRSAAVMALVLIAGARLVPLVLLVPAAFAAASAAGADHPRSHRLRVWREVTVGEGFVTSILEVSGGCLLTIGYRTAEVVSLTEDGVSRGVLTDDSITFPVPALGEEGGHIREIVTGLLGTGEPVEVVLRFEVSSQDSTLNAARLRTSQFTIGVGQIDDLP